MSTRLRAVGACICASATALAITALGVASPAASTAGASPAGSGSADRPDRVVVIVVDALSREIVEKYDMDNVQALMRRGVDTPRGYLGHLGSITVVTHNVVPTGQLPRNMGWVSEGYDDVDGVLSAFGDDDSDQWITSDWTSEQMFAVHKSVGYPHLADYLHEMRPGSKVITVSPKSYAGYAFGGAGSDSIITFSGRNYDCDGDGTNNWRGPSGINVPTYLSEPTCGRWYVDSSSSLTYDTDLSPARLYPLDGNRYTVGKDPAHEGGDVWAADAAIAAMDNEDWSGIQVTLPGVDKSAHMWGGVIDPGGPEPMTHIEEAARVADEQVGKIIQHLKDTGEYDNTLVVLTADHGAVPAKTFHGIDDGTANRGIYNWYYGDVENGAYLSPQPALQPLIDTGNVEMSYADSQLAVWLKDDSPAARRDTAEVMRNLPDVTSVWQRDEDGFDRIGRVRWDRMARDGERAWFARHAQELLDTMAAPTGPELVATLPDDTTYSVAGDHGGLQRRAQQIPILFGGGAVGSRDLRAPVHSIDILPTVLRELGLEPTYPLDGVAYRLPQPR